MGRACELTRRARPAAAPPLALALVLLAASAAAVAQETHEAPPTAPNTWYTRGAVAALKAAETTHDPQAAGAAALNSGIADAIARLSRPGPDWLRRSKIQLRLSNELQPGYDVLTLQPLYRSASGRDTVLVEGRLAHGGGADRTTGNAGLGYRRLLYSDRVLLGASGSYDRAWPDDERRLGLGAELRSRPFEVNATYQGTVPAENATGAPGSAEILDRFELEFGAHVPYLPWVRLYGETFWEETNALGDTTGGERFGLRLNPLPPPEVELGCASKDATEPVYFARLRFTKALGGPPPRPRGPLIDAEAFAFDDVSARALDRVRR